MANVLANQSGSGGGRSALPMPGSSGLLASGVDMMMVADLSRGRCWMASCCTIMPPMEAPATWADSSP